MWAIALGWRSVLLTLPLASAFLIRGPHFSLQLGTFPAAPEILRVLFKGFEIHVAGWPPFFETPEGMPWPYHVTKETELQACQFMAMEGTSIILVATQVFRGKHAGRGCDDIRASWYPICWAAPAWWRRGLVCCGYRSIDVELSQVDDWRCRTLLPAGPSGPGFDCGPCRPSSYTFLKNFTTD